jgi:hypothetical protein
MPSELLKIISDRLHGMPYDIDKYVDAIDGIIVRVYKNRYRGISGAKNVGEKLGGPDSKKLSGSTGFAAIADFSAVNFETFQNVCWDELEENNLFSKLASLTFNDDAHLYKHIQVAFENILEKMIFDLTPGFETRKKQVYRVLKTCCNEIRENNRRHWKLKGVEFTDAEPASLRELLLISQSFSTPKIHISRAGSKYGPSIKDIDMKEYLLNILNAAGGMAAYNDILSLVKERLGIKTMKETLVTFQGRGENESEGNTEEKIISRLAINKKEPLLGSDHLLMAQEIVQRMDFKLKSIFYKRYIEEKKIKDIAKNMDCNTTSVFNKIEELKEYLKNYFRSSGKQASSEEQRAVVQVVCSLIEKELA